MLALALGAEKSGENRKAMSPANKKLMEDVSKRASEVIPWQLWISFDILLLKGHCIKIIDGDPVLYIVPPKQNYE